jgi:hypothetical protein
MIDLQSIVVVRSGIALARGVGPPDMGTKGDSGQMPYDANRPNHRELKVMRLLCIGSIEESAKFPGVGEKTFSEMVSKGWIEHAHDPVYGTNGYRMTSEGDAVWEANYKRVR